MTLHKPNYRLLFNRTDSQTSFPIKGYRASQTWRQFGVLCFQLFLFAQFFSIARDFFIENLGGGMADYATVISTGSVILLFPTWFAYMNFTGHLFGQLDIAGKRWVASLLALVFLLALYGGLWHGYAIEAIVHDLTAYFILIICIILGSIPQFWKDISKIFLILFVLAIIVNAFGFNNINMLIARYGFEDRFGIETVAYQTQSALNLWPLLLLTARFRKPLSMLIILFGVMFVLVEQVLFQKRLGVATVLVYLVVFYIYIPSFFTRWAQKWQSQNERILRITSLGLLFLGFGAALVFAPQLFQSQATSLINRYTNNENTERLNEAIGMIKGLRGLEYFIGRGMGGYFEYATSGFVWGVWLNDIGVIGRREMHVGFLMPMLKGGLLLMTAYYGGIVTILLSWKSSVKDPFSLSAYIIVLLTTLLTLQGGFMIGSSSFDLILVGICTGRCLATNTARSELIMIR